MTSTVGAMAGIPQVTGPTTFDRNVTEVSAMPRLAGKVAIVTGAGQGIGRGIALALAKEGATAVVAGRTLDKGESVAAEIADAGGRALAVQCDVANRADVDRLVDVAVEAFGTVDILVNNAQAIPRNRRLQNVPV